MTLDQYEVAVAEAICLALCGSVADMYPKGIEMGRAVLRRADYDIDTAHGEMLAPKAAAEDALAEFSAKRRTPETVS